MSNIIWVVIIDTSSNSRFGFIRAAHLTSACPVPDLESVGVCSTIVAEHFGAMALPVGEFLALEHGTEFWGVDRAELQARRRAAGPRTPFCSPPPRASRPAGLAAGGARPHAKQAGR